MNGVFIFFLNIGKYFQLFDECNIIEKKRDTESLLDYFASQNPHKATPLASLFL